MKKQKEVIRWFIFTHTPQGTLNGAMQETFQKLYMVTLAPESISLFCSNGFMDNPISYFVSVGEVTEIKHNTAEK